MTFQVGIQVPRSADYPNGVKMLSGTYTNLKDAQTSVAKYKRTFPKTTDNDIHIFDEEELKELKEVDVRSRNINAEEDRD